MLGKAVNFSGTAWPGAKVTGSRNVADKGSDPSGLAPASPGRVFNLRAEGKPRPWATTEAQGFWRSFAEMMLAADKGSGESIANFVRKYGDPVGALGADTPSTTAGWANLVALLAPLASAWGPANVEDVSSVEHGADVIAWVRFAVLTRLPGQVTLIPDPTGAPDLVPRADSLAGFMLVSAVSGLNRQAEMRRCRVCTTWFELPRKDALYCSSACRAIHHREQLAAAGREEAAALARLADPVGHRRKQAELAAQMKALDPAERRRKQAEMDALMRHLNKKPDNKKD